MQTTLSGMKCQSSTISEIKATKLKQATSFIYECKSTIITTVPLGMGLGCSWTLVKPQLAVQAAPSRPELTDFPAVNHPVWQITKLPWQLAPMVQIPAARSYLQNNLHVVRVPFALLVASELRSAVQQGGDNTGLLCVYGWRRDKRGRGSEGRGCGAAQVSGGDRHVPASLAGHRSWVSVAWALGSAGVQEEIKDV